MAVDSFFSYKHYRWLWINLALLAALILGYILDAPLGPRNGGTFLGYTYGIVGALGILYLMWYGIRKRSYHARFTTLKGCLSAHVWLGISLAIIVPLHAGFQFGCNVHTLTYVLMMVVVISGIWGAIQYIRLADQIDSNRGGGSLKKVVEQVHLLSKEIERRSNQKSDQLLSLLRAIDFEFSPSVMIRTSRIPNSNRKEVADLLTQVPSQEKNEAVGLIGVVAKKRDLVLQLAREGEVSLLLRGWLYVHVPLSCALLMCLFVHIVTVLFYR